MATNCRCGVTRRCREAMLLHSCSKQLISMEVWRRGGGGGGVERSFGLCILTSAVSPLPPPSAFNRQCCYNRQWGTQQVFGSQELSPLRATSVMFALIGLTMTVILYSMLVQHTHYLNHKHLRSDSRLKCRHNFKGKFTQNLWTADEVISRYFKMS
jgi:hypothetical protein